MTEAAKAQEKRPSIQPGSLTDLRTSAAPVLGNEAAALWDIGDGVACFEIRTKMNTFDPNVLDALEDTLARTEREFGALVLGNDDPRAFSAGADLSFVFAMIERKDWRALGRYFQRGQTTFQSLKYAPFPVVAAVHGFALGGGCEFMLHADTAVAQADLRAGLPEFKVGLIPAWGGCTQLLIRCQNRSSGPDDPIAAAKTAFDLLCSARISKSASEAQAMGILRTSDRIVPDRSALLPTARDAARDLVEGGYVPPAPDSIDIGGSDGWKALMSNVGRDRAAGRISDGQAAVCEILADIVTGGAVFGDADRRDEAYILQLEREGAETLVKTAYARDAVAGLLEQ